MRIQNIKTRLAPLPCCQFGNFFHVSAHKNTCQGVQFFESRINYWNYIHSRNFKNKWHDSYQI